MSDERPASPTEVATPTHPAGCSCGCLHSGFPKSLYRKFRDDPSGEVFTGILLMDSDRTLFKLDDPNGDVDEGDALEDLQGKGRVMTGGEATLELKQYNADPAERTGPAGDLHVRDMKGILKDFAEKPADFDIKTADRARFHTVFPHGIPAQVHRRGRWTVPQVRAGDTVKIMAAKYSEMAQRECSERLWVHVEAVANPGVIIGQMANDIESPLMLTKQFPTDMTMDQDYHYHAGTLVSFPVTCVFGVEHGENWKD
jgi:hypothetical protein